MKHLGIKGKLISAFLAASIIPLLFIGFFSYYKSSKTLEEQALSKIDAIRVTKLRALESYFEQVKNQLLVFTHSEPTKAALIKFTDSFSSFQKDSKLSDVDVLAHKAKILKYYQKDFSEEFSKQNEGKVPDVMSVLSKLSNLQILLQSKYIAENPNPLGSKHLMDSSPGSEMYNRVHGFYHPDMKEFLNKFSFYDIFIIDAESGQVVYSVFKELDFATSLVNGPYSDSSLAVAFRGALALTGDNDIFMADYKTYLPSYNSPASFLSAPIKIGGIVRGVLVFQIPFDKINQIASQKVTEDKTLETFLVGSDYHMRSDTLSDPNKTVKTSFKNPELGKIENQDIKDALAGKNILSKGLDYLGRKALVSGSAFNVHGHQWMIKTIITEEEALSPLVTMRWAIILGLIVSVSIVISLATWYATSLSNSLVSVAEGLREGALTLKRTSTEIAEVSQKLSEASTEQASSLQETVSSIDEISAMVERNADSASSSLSTSQSSTIAAKEGKDKVGFMIVAINDISSENESIMKSIQKSNAEISEIVKVILEISDKTKVINDIVFQTKLLSFNASVEAARAGEHGKGFAVVAEEVGNLASMSGKAATEISDMLEKSVQKVNSIVNGTKVQMDGLMRSSKEKVDVGTKIAKECAISLDEILTNTSTVNQLVTEISTASQEQSTGVREITKAMAELDQVTQSNSMIANDSSVSANDLRDQAERLNKFVLSLSKIVNGNDEQLSNLSQHAQVLSINQAKNSKSNRPNNKSAMTKKYTSEIGPPHEDDSRFEEI